MSVDRIKKDLETIKDFTTPCEEGTTRLSYTPAYRDAADYVITQMKAAGLEPMEDGAGNIWGVRKGKNPDAPKIISGSHLDTVKCSGYFDGQAGIICALEAARMMEDNNDRLEGDYEVLATIMEEGARYQNLTGSKLAMGVFGEDMLDSMADEDGITLRQAMKNYGLSGDIAGICRKDENIKAFIEIHMEQGRKLEKGRLDLGIVETIWGCRWFTLTAKGVTAHPSTAMAERKDTLLASAKLISRISDIVSEQYVGKATVTVGKMNLYPGNINAIPSRTQFSMDFRTGYEKYFHELDAILKKEIKRAEDEYRVEFSYEIFSYTPPTPNSKNIQDALDAAIKEQGFSSMHLDSGAGHDAMVFGTKWPIGMMFVPSRLGLTHCKEEWTDYGNLEKASKVLYTAVKNLDAQ